jgi:hypothetical protein
MGDRHKMAFSKHALSHLQIRYNGKTARRTVAQSPTGAQNNKERSHHNGGIGRSSLQMAKPLLSTGRDFGGLAGGRQPSAARLAGRSITTYL